MSVSAGAAHSYALLKSGKIQCWGENYAGQLGNGITEEFDKLTPKEQRLYERKHREFRESRDWGSSPSPVTVSGF
jgi:alpha-tubulin suppressor-like RCC1 family protein